MFVLVVHLFIAILQVICDIFCLNISLIFGIVTLYLEHGFIDGEGCVLSFMFLMYTGSCLGLLCCVMIDE